MKMKLNLTKQTQYIFFAVSLPCHYHSSLREFYKINGTVLGGKDNIRLPMENFIGIWWSGSEQDVLPAGDAAHGYKSLALHNTGSDYPLYDDLKKYLYDTSRIENGDRVAELRNNS